MLVSEDLALLLHDDDSGKGVTDRHTVGLALAGGVLVELAIRGHVRVADDGEDVKEGRLVVETDGSTGDDLLDDGLEIVRGKEGRRPKASLEKLRKGLRERVLERLEAAGELRRDEKKALGIVSYTRWPAGDGHREDEVRRDVHAALLDGADPDERTAALIGLVQAIDQITKVVPTDDKKALKRRAEEIADGPWAAEAVRSAVADVQVAVMTAVIASTSASTAAVNS
ncbi:GOLPH3/VPS74 family protein [Patulibacter minatonensis]|uniref:GOLPH3/VPS74 family protein n=1 Tax=Patulibacter minatonensis TaxID=298163 RepID=UPI000479DB37|nr:GPP34 family phosphoprotein [Patulibacter minatonensis]